VAVRAPVRARGYGAGRRARCQCVAERATALKARVLHARAWNFIPPHSVIIDTGRVTPCTRATGGKAKLVDEPGPPTGGASEGPGELSGVMRCRV